MKQELIDFLKIYDDGIENNEFVNSCKVSSPNRFKSLYSVSRLFLQVLISKRKGVNDNFRNLKLEWQPLHKTVLQSNDGMEVSVVNHKHVQGEIKLYQLCSLKDIITFLLTIPHSVRQRNYDSSWLTFRILDRLIAHSSIKSINIAGHYDAYTTWIALLAKRYGKELTISQHGVCAGVELPHRIPVNRILSFSQAEAEMFKRFLLNPEKTIFEIKGFKSSVHFERGGFSRRTIAIASQPGYESLVKELSAIIIQKVSSSHLIIYPHPLDSYRNVDYLKVDGFDIQVTRKRYNDIDILIIFNSTLAYDYIACPDFRGQIVCYYHPLDNTDLAVYHDSRIHMIRPSEFESYLTTQLP